MKLPLVRSLAARLIISHLIVGVVSVGLIASIAGRFIMESGRREVENIYEDIAFLLSNRLEITFINLAQGNPVNLEAAKQEIERDLSGRPNVNFAVFTTDGTVLITNEPASDFSSVLPPEFVTALREPDAVDVRINGAGQETFYIAVPISHQNIIYGVLRLSSNFNDNLGPTYRAIFLLWIIAILILVGVVVGSWWYSNTLSQPIRNLTTAARRLSNGELESRVMPQGPSEFQQFASTFNQMASQLQNNMEGLQAFVANASHELRTPLTAIKLHVDALAEGAIAEPEVATHFLSQLQGEIDRMNRTVNDLLDLSRIEANRGSIPMEKVDLSGVLLETRDFWRARSLSSDIDLSLSLPNSVSPVNGNDDQLRRVFNNFIDNAIKNTDPGGWVEINLFNLPQRGVVRIEVRDNGHGIPAEHLPRIFERFYRAEVPIGRKIPGSGLGLAIAKSIIEMHNGKIGVSSLVGVGSTFWVELPIPGFTHNEQKSN
jgi:signal transduction histidine kinase